MTQAFRFFIDATRRSLRFARAASGVAAVEFALILPLMLLMYLGSTEVTQGLMASRNATLTARTLADLVSQEQNNVPVTDAILSQAFTASNAIMAPFPSNALAMTITSVEFVADSNSPTGYDAKPRWIATQNGGAPRPCAILTPVADGSSPSPTTMPKGVYAQGSLIVADIIYTYRPTFGGAYFAMNQIPSFLTYIHSAYMRPRQWTSSPYIQYGGSTATICPAY